MPRLPSRLIVVSWLLLSHALAAEAPVPVPPAVSAVLTAVQETADPEQNLAVLAAYRGPAHALIAHARGQALAARGQPAAAAAFTAALRLDPNLREAHLGLARLAAAAGAWAEAVRRLAPAVEVTSSPAPWLAFYAECAVQAGDWQLAGTIADLGLTRFPDEPSFRRLALARLVRSGRAREAETVVRTLLDAAPATGALWHQLAWCAAQEGGDPQTLLAALELGVLAEPGDRALAQRLAQARLAQGLPHAALALVRDLLATGAEPELLLLGARAAGEAGEPATGRAWLARLPPNLETRTSRLLAARLAVQEPDPAAARAILDTLISSGENAPQVLTWAGHLAEADGDAARAEALYQQATAAPATGPQADTAKLRLIALYLRQQRRDEAAVHLAAYLADHPDDAQARQLRALLGDRRN